MTYVNHPVENIDRKETLNNPPQSSPAFGGSSLSRFQFKHLILYTRPADSPLLTSWALPSLGHHSGSSLRSASQHLPPHLTPPPTQGVSQGSVPRLEQWSCPQPLASSVLPAILPNPIPPPQSQNLSWMAMGSTQNTDAALKHSPLWARKLRSYYFFKSR